MTSMDVDARSKYERQKAQKLEYFRRVAAAGKDIGPPPDIADVDRRMRGKESLLEFARAYHPEAIYLDLAEFHKTAIRKLEESVLLGALFAFAFPRGSGKTTWVRIASHWAISYAHRYYPFIIGANADKAQENLDFLKISMRFNDAWTADFPEISHAIMELAGQAAKARGQTSQGRATNITWQKDKIVLPDMSLPANHPDFDPNDEMKLAPTSGIVVAVSGLTGDGIRGSVHTKSNGQQVRPDFVFLDDPQSDESAASPTQIATREKLLNGAVLGMAGPDKKISGAMPCTVIHPGDLADRILNRQENPLWRGERIGILSSMPKHMGAWESYFEVYARCSQKDPPDFTEANAHYQNNQSMLDEGAVPTWPARKNDNEVTAIQSAMHLFFRDRNAFWAEYMNQPLGNDTGNSYLTALQISRKIHQQARGIPPQTVEKIVAFIDVQQTLLYWAVVGFSSRFDGFVIDYGTFPEQPSRYFKLTNAAVPLEKKYPHAGPEAQLYRGLTDLTAAMRQQVYVRADGISMPISRIGVDCGYQTRLIEKWLQDHSPRDVVLTRGYGVKATDEPWANRKPKPGDLIGHHWRQLVPKDLRQVRVLDVDVNYWKTFTHLRFATEVADPGSLSLYKADELTHRMLAEHCKAEFSIKVSAKGREVEEWKMKPNAEDNHFFDCIVNSHALASFEGIRMESAQGDVRGRRRIAAKIPKRGGR